MYSDMHVYPEAKTAALNRSLSERSECQRGPAGQFCVYEV